MQDPAGVSCRDLSGGNACSQALFTASDKSCTHGHFVVLLNYMITRVSPLGAGEPVFWCLQVLVLWKRSSSC